VSRRVAGLALRLLVLAAVAWLLASQIRWHDATTLASGEVLRGRATAEADGGWTVRAPDGSLRRLAASEVGTRRVGAGEVPAVAFGLATLGARLFASPGALLLVGLLLVFAQVATAARWFVLLRAVDLPLPPLRVLRLQWVGAFFNQAVPGSTGGDVVKAWYAAVATGRPTRAVISVFVDRLLGLVALALFAGAALLLAPAAAGLGPARAVVLGVLGIGAAVGALVLSPGLRRAVGLSALGRRLPFQGFLAEVGAAARLYRSHPVALVNALLLSLVNHAVNAVAVWLLAGALSIHGVTLGAALALVPVANVMAGVPLVPGGWGVGELAFAWLFAPLGVPPTEAIGLSVLYRLGVLAVGLPGGALWLFWRDRPSRAALRREVEVAVEGEA
jgi:uncharacterized membrane protein YbhN (UPF0104 family)